MSSLFLIFLESNFLIILSYMTLLYLARQLQRGGPTQFEFIIRLSHSKNHRITILGDPKLSLKSWFLHKC